MLLAYDLKPKALRPAWVTMINESFVLTVLSSM
jgi:hypothetical protein